MMAKPAKRSKQQLARMATEQRDRESFDALDPAHRAQLMVSMERHGKTEAGFLDADARASLLAGEDNDFAANGWYWRVSENAREELLRLGIEPLPNHLVQLEAAYHAAYRAAV